MNNKVLTLSVGIPAYNEEANIACLLDSIILQKQTGYILERIIIASDGSSDDTAKIVQEYSARYPIIELISDGKRMGHISRLNQIYAMNTSDIILNLDGDVTLADELTLSAIVGEFVDSKIGLVGGNDTPLTPRTFFEKIVVTHIKLWHNVRKGLNGGDSVYNNHGCVSALSKEFARNAHIPPSIIAQDTYLYFRALELGYRFRYARAATVYYRVPSNFRDYLAQVSRFRATRSKITDHFGSWIEPYRQIPFSKKLRAILVTFLHHPILLPLTLGLQVVTKVALRNVRSKTLRGGLWEPVSSTKVAHKKRANI